MQIAERAANETKKMRAISGRRILIIVFPFILNVNRSIATPTGLRGGK
jgi:hypothetical protein